MPQQHASVSQGLICSDSCMCFHTEIEVADETCHLTQSHSVLALGQPVPALTPKHRAPGSIATGIPILEPLVWLDLEKNQWQKWETGPPWLRQTPYYLASEAVLVGGGGGRHTSEAVLDGGTPVRQCWMGGGREGHTSEAVLDGGEMGGHTSEAVLDGGRWGGTPVRQCWMGGRGHTSEAVLDGGTPVRQCWMGGTPVRQCWMGGTPVRQYWMGGGGGEMGGTPVRQCWMGGEGGTPVRQCWMGGRWGAHQ